MYGFKIFALAAALACGVVAHETCAPAVTVTVTVKECGTPGLPVFTAPVPSYEVPSSSPPPATSVESTATAPLSPPPDNPTATTIASPAPPAGTGVPPVVSIPSSGQPVAPGLSSSESAPGTTTRPSSTAAVTRPSPSTSTPATVSTAGAVLTTPYIGLGSLFAAGAVLNAALAVV